MSNNGSCFKISADFLYNFGLIDTVAEKDKEISDINTYQQIENISQSELKEKPKTRKLKK